jgi:hypothetical protein
MKARFINQPFFCGLEQESKLKTDSLFQAS